MSTAAVPENEVKDVQVEKTSAENNVSTDAPEEEEQEQEESVTELLEQAKRHFALRQWDQAVDVYGRTLEALSEEHSEDEPIFAPLHHRYGHALLEHAIATSGALGGGGRGKDAPMPSRGGGNATTVASARAKEGKKTAAEAAASAAGGSSSSASKPSDPRFTFGGDAEESDEEEDEQEGAAQADAEEDDLGDAFAVLELARVQYEKLLEQNATLKTLDGDEWSTLIIRGQLAEVLNDLADVGLESENFQQASADYQSALDLLEPLLQAHSRRLADAYLRLGLALEFHPDAHRQASAEQFVKSAATVLRRRFEALEDRKSTLEHDRKGSGADVARSEEEVSQARAENAEAESVARLREEGVLSSTASDAVETTNANGKGKAKSDGEQDGAQKLEKDDVAAMDWQAIEKEMRDVKEMLRELELKLEEYANAPPGTDGVAAGSNGQGALGSAETKAALQQAINEALLGASTNSLSGKANGGSSAGEEVSGSSLNRALDPSVTVNDLSAMVKKKKRAAPAEGAAPSSSATAGAEAGGSSKKVRVEDAAE